MASLKNVSFARLREELANRVQSEVTRLKAEIAAKQAELAEVLKAGGAKTTKSGKQRGRPKGSKIVNGKLVVPIQEASYSPKASRKAK